MKKALVLISGGLDSLLAAKILMAQKIQVIGVNFFTGFTGDTPPALKNNIPIKLQTNTAQNLTAKLGIDMRVIDISEEYKKIMAQPKYGYGAHLNPCLDCKLFMVGCAKKYCKEFGCDFIATGEVMGQRPKSQRKDTLPIIAKNSDDLLLRPLSAKLLPETKIEKNGWVKRENLYAISGRGRKEQIALAKHFDIEDYLQPAGGCLLTDKNFCARLSDIWQYQHKDKNYSLNDIMLVRLGRHLRIAPNLKLIVGRDKQDNEAISHYQTTYPCLTTSNVPGAMVLLQGEYSAQNIIFAAQTAAYFSKGKNQKMVEVLLYWPTKNAALMKVAPLSYEQIKK